MSDSNLPLNIPSIDVFITNRCGLRCSHCFVGEDLNLNLDLDFDLFERLIKTARIWGTHEITFLGGEPTLYPKFIDAVLLAQQEGYRTRVVTNGHLSYLKFIENFKSDSLPFICFSIDGSNSDTHDLIRGKGSFNYLIKNIQRSKELGYRLGGITAISRQNVHDVADILHTCDSLGLEYVNIHYVTNRGFAAPDIVLSIDEWKAAYNIIKRVSTQISTELRVEKTFFAAGTVGLKCSVQEKSNLMFLPDGRVYMCMMFIDIPNSHSFVWTKAGLIKNTSLSSEQHLVNSKSIIGCPAMALVNQSICKDAGSSEEFVQCIYQKERL